MNSFYIYIKIKLLNSLFNGYIYIKIKFSHKIFVVFVRKLSNYFLSILNNFNFPSYANHFLILIKIEMPKTILLWQKKKKERKILFPFMHLGNFLITC